MQAIYTTDVEIGLLKNPGFEKINLKIKRHMKGIN